MRKAFLFVSLFFYSYCFAQKTDTLIKKLDSLNTNKTGPQKNVTSAAAYNDQTKLNFKSYFILLGSDLKQEFTAPFHWKAKDWALFGAFVGVEVALTASDEPIQKWAFNLGERNKPVHGVGQYVTQFGGTYEGYVLAGFGMAGFVFHNQKMVTTTLLATQSYITAGAMEAFLKTITGRQRPTVVTSTGESEP